MLSQFTQEVSVWDLEPPRHVATFSTILDFGGTRLGLSADGGTVVCAAYHREGVAAYAAGTGELLWQKRDVKRPQRVSLSSSRRLAYVATDDNPCLALSLDDGEVVRRLPGVRWVVESPFAPLRFIDHNRPAVTNEEFEPLVAIPRSTFAFLDVAFGPDTLVVTESGGPVTCFDLTSGRKLWAFVPDNGVHCLAATYCEDIGAFAGVLWPFANGGPKELVAFGDRGSPSTITGLGDSADECFCQRGSCLLTSSGSLVSLASGLATALLPLPA